MSSENFWIVTAELFCSITFSEVIQRLKLNRVAELLREIFKDLCWLLVKTWLNLDSYHFIKRARLFRMQIMCWRNYHMEETWHTHTHTEKKNLLAAAWHVNYEVGNCPQFMQVPVPTCSDTIYARSFHVQLWFLMIKTYLRHFALLRFLIVICFCQIHVLLRLSRRNHHVKEVTLQSWKQ